MCTMSWFKTVDGYELFFNRDELKTRRRAQKPMAYSDNGVQIIAPSDTDAGGTWISVNHFGISLCLLNHYEKESTDRHINWISRGEIIRQLSSYSSLAEIEENFLRLDVSQYRAFRLYVLTPLGKSVFFTWDGQTMLKEYDIAIPRSSSSYQPERVRKVRKQLFANQGLAESTDRQSYLDFHKSHDPDKSAYSVCMHRDDASSVSLSHIVVTAQTIAFSYADGAPCETELSLPLEMPRVDVIADDAA